MSDRFVDRYLALMYNPGMEIKYREKKWEMKAGMTARDALKKIGVDPESVLITINGKLVTDDALLKDTDQVKLVAVVSGG
ncbi:MAG: MoaD/ThiS family protein [Chloroflexi bacterium]|nr:MoaD/ThiS family protein [Chloroflexota bacterium]